MSTLNARMSQRTEVWMLAWAPYVALAAWGAAIGLRFALDPMPQWIELAIALAHVMVVIAFAWAALDLLRVWGTARRAITAVALIGVISVAASVARPVAPGAGQALAVLSGTLFLVLGAIYLWPRQVADRLPRSPAWEVLHRLSAVTAKAEPLSQNDAVERAPEFVRMIEGAQQFRTDETAEYLDLFAKIADADLALAPEPDDRAALDARWQILHRELARKFAPFSTWHVAPEPVPDRLDAGT